jgi:hypothetical protein
MSQSSSLFCLEQNLEQIEKEQDWFYFKKTLKQLMFKGLF